MINPDKAVNWLISALVTVLSGVIAMGVTKLDELADSVIELNQHMAVVANTVKTNKEQLEKQDVKLEDLEWLRDPEVKKRILFQK